MKERVCGRTRSGLSWKETGTLVHPLSRILSLPCHGNGIQLSPHPCKHPISSGLHFFKPEGTLGVLPQGGSHNHKWPVQEVETHTQTGSPNAGNEKSNFFKKPHTRKEDRGGKINTAVAACAETTLL